MRIGRPEEAVATADLALDLAEHLGLERIIAETFNNKGSSLGYLGRRREALVLLRAAVDTAHAGGFVAAETRALSNLGAQSDDVQESGARYAAAAELALRVGNRNMANWATVAQRYSALLAAEGWDAVIEESSDANADDAENPQDAFRRLSVLCYFIGPRGESLDGVIERMTALLDELSDPTAAPGLQFARAQQAVVQGDLPRAIELGLLAGGQDPVLGRIYRSQSLHLAFWRRDLAQAREISALLDADPATGTDPDFHSGRSPRRDRGPRGSHRRGRRRLPPGLRDGPLDRRRVPARRPRARPGDPPRAGSSRLSRGRRGGPRRSWSGSRRVSGWSAWTRLWPRVPRRAPAGLRLRGLMRAPRRRPEPRPRA